MNRQQFITYVSKRAAHQAELDLKTRLEQQRITNLELAIELKADKEVSSALPNRDGQPQRRTEETGGDPSCFSGCSTPGQRGSLCSAMLSLEPDII